MAKVLGYYSTPHSCGYFERSIYRWMFEFIKHPSNKHYNWTMCRDKTTRISPCIWLWFKTHHIPFSKCFRYDILFLSVDIFPSVFHSSITWVSKSLKSPFWPNHVKIMDNWVCPAFLHNSEHDGVIAAKIMWWIHICVEENTLNILYILHLPTCLLQFGSTVYLFYLV